MRLTIVAIGKLKRGPEQELVARYADRLKSGGKSVGVTDIKIVEISESRAGTAELRKADEARRIDDVLAEKTVVWAFDERGSRPDSSGFADIWRQNLDNGTQNLALVIGGPDGLDPAFREKSDCIISFGSLTIPHQLVRILVLEQAYRAVTILTNHPYHRQ